MPFRKYRGTSFNVMACHAAKIIFRMPRGDGNVGAFRQESRGDSAAREAAAPKSECPMFVHCPYLLLRLNGPPTSN